MEFMWTNAGNNPWSSNYRLYAVLFFQLHNSAYEHFCGNYWVEHQEGNIKSNSRQSQINMKRIGLLSDTHGYWDDRYEKYFSECDEIWHAGDIGSYDVAQRLSQIKPLRAVFGNIDGYDVRSVYTEKYRFKCEDVDVLIKHIGGYPGHYDPSIKGTLYTRPPQLFISGHSHILSSSLFGLCYRHRVSRM